MKDYRLYHYWRSTSSWRVRWAFAVKGVSYDRIDFVPINLLSDEAESEAHRQRNPFGYVPALEILSGPHASQTLIESVAIVEYLEETLPGVPLLPSDPLDRARVRAMVEAVNAGTQPLQNLNAQHFHAPEEEPGFEEKRKKWAQHWLSNGMQAFEKLCAPVAGDFSFGDQLTFADLCLIPQCYAAARVGIDVSDYPTLRRIHANATATESYRLSEPERFKPE